MISVADPNPHGSAFNLPPGSESGFGMRIQFRIQLLYISAKSRNLHRSLKLSKKKFNFSSMFFPHGHYIPTTTYQW
jgi:hypothetical protein